MALQRSCVPRRKPASQLRLARLARGWRFGALANQIGVPASTLWRIETGSIKAPRPEIRIALAKVLKMKQADLFKQVGR